MTIKQQQRFSSSTVCVILGLDPADFLLPGVQWCGLLGTRLSHHTDLLSFFRDKIVDVEL